MNQEVTLPLWAFVLILLFAVVTFASHFLFPSVRWFFRKRAERVIARLNTRLQRPIEPFKLARRYDMIQRLIYDPEVTRAIVAHAEAEDVPESVAFEQAKRYAREIVPGFSATAYFTIGMRLAKWLSRALYRVRIASFDRATLSRIDPDATVIFVINHRSNMDYVLVTHLVSRATSLSYAVGEWARVWPLSAIIRAMGAYFIRRKSRGQLYRKVLARYVQMATTNGVTQAMFPEGGLSVSGAVGDPKLGLLNYIVGQTERDVIFVPVGINYDRVLEDTFLVAAETSGRRRFRPPLLTTVRRILSHLWRRVRGRFRGFGVASVGFGRPLELSAFREGRGEEMTQELGEELMRRIKEIVPVLSAPLVAYLLTHRAPMTRTELLVAVRSVMAGLGEMKMPIPQRKPEVFLSDTLDRFRERGLIAVSDEKITVTDLGDPILTYYGRSIAHHLENLPRGSDAIAA